MSRFIVVEGVDGAGKSTLVRALTEALEADGYEVVSTREPGGTPLAEEIRSFMLSDEGAKLSSAEQLRLVHKGRVDHVKNKIHPALHSGKVVISDRYELSSWVYQVTHSKDELKEEFFAMQAELQEHLGGFEPQYVFLDLPEAEVEQRLKKSEKLNHFDAISLEAIAKRRQAYQEGIEAVGHTYHALDALLNPDALLLETRRRLGL